MPRALQSSVGMLGRGRTQKIPLTNEASGIKIEILVCSDYLRRRAAWTKASANVPVIIASVDGSGMGRADESAEVLAGRGVEGD
ncbi:MAG: hypothetical protein ACI9FZ_000333 [Bacteroidia bacterium]|jgi:hypothetical protein